MEILHSHAVDKLNQQFDLFSIVRAKVFYLETFQFRGVLLQKARIELHQRVLRRSVGQWAFLLLVSLLDRLNERFVCLQ